MQLGQRDFIFNIELRCPVQQPQATYGYLNLINLNWP